MHKNAMKNTKTAAEMEIMCGGGGVCVCVCVCVCTGAFARVHTHTQAERAILYGVVIGHLFELYYIQEKTASLLGLL